MKTRRGVTFIEALVSLVVAAIGISGVASVLIASSRMVRRTQTHTQALSLAQRELEGIAALGCNPDPAAWCSNVTALDGRRSSAWLSVDSGLRTVAPATPDPSLREYTVSVDVDPPYEGAERGSPLIERPLDNGSLRGSIVNVRVTVSWLEGTRLQSEALQTRMSP